MDPISIGVVIEVSTLVLAGVGAFATWLHHQNQVRLHKQRDAHHHEMRTLAERHHNERMGRTPPVTNGAPKTINSAPKMANRVSKPK